MRIGILGTGSVGRALAAGLQEAGHDVVLGTRDPQDTLARTAVDGMGNPPFADWYAEHDGIDLAPFAGAGADGELVVNATCGATTMEVLAAVAAEGLRGKVLWDVANPLDFSGGMPPSLTIVNTDSLAETIQRAYPDARVVKGLNTVNASVMVDPARVPGPHHVFVAGDDAAARSTVARLLGELGWPSSSVLDLGGIQAARGLEMFLPLWVTLYGHLGTADFNIRIATP